MPTEEQKKKISAYINNSSDELDSILLDEVFKINHQEFAFKLNAILRANLATPTLENYLFDFDNLTHSVEVTEPLTTYRACNYLEMLPRLLNNKYHDLGYMSTSSRKENIIPFFTGAGHYIPAYLNITIPEGSRILLMDQIDDVDNTTYENEILIGRKASFNVNSIETINNDLEEYMGYNAFGYKELIIIELTFTGYLPF